MDLEGVRSICLAMPGSSESFPFDDDTLVFKVGNKMFCLADLNPPQSINIKLPAEEIPDILEHYDWTGPGYHMNKKYWITISLEDCSKSALLKDWIRKSYSLVYAGLSRKEREEIEKLNNP